MLRCVNSQYVSNLYPCLQRLAHELPLCVAQPPFARHTGLVGVHPVEKPRGQFLSHLHDVLPQNLCLLPICRRLEGLVQWEPSISRDREVGVERQVHDGLTILVRPLPSLPLLWTHLLGLSPRHARLDLAKDFAHKQDAINHNAVGGTLDLEVAKEGVCAEKGQDLIERIVRLVRSIDGELGDVGWKRWELLCGAAGSCAERKKGEVAWQSCELVYRFGTKVVRYQSAAG
jgi:hypothetical protein